MNLQLDKPLFKNEFDYVNDTSSMKSQVLNSLINKNLSLFMYEA